MKPTPRIRYFTRFRGEYGYIYALLRFYKTRKTINTKIIISREQAKRFCSDGSFLPPTTIDDCELECVTLDKYTRNALKVVGEMVANNTFAETPGESIPAMIEVAMREEMIKSFDFVKIPKK